MTTQIVFKIDSKLKKAAQKKARETGITLSDLYQNTTRSFVAGEISVGLRATPEIPNARTARELDAALKDIKAGRNLSPVFDNAVAAIAYLKKHAR